MTRYTSNDAHRNARAIRRALFKHHGGFEDAYLLGADLCGVNLFGADLRRAQLTDASLMDANFRDANLECASLSGARCARTSFGGANLKGADLAGASLNDASFTLTDWRGNPCFDEHTKWPTDEFAYAGATLDGKSFLETVAFYRELTASPDPDIREKLAALKSAQSKANQWIAQSMNVPGASYAFRGRQSASLNPYSL